ncbi:uncharacterized protein LOC128964580 [Oppia nitens]|uniref:uncharacterized protein LOC128964580 n=1 Tax=Oppia nitens TaxID=1686743 RepID=UPI0023DB01BA|nr:uncharacterized protein LOC128964580 [Oppia nitens]
MCELLDKFKLCSKITEQTKLEIKLFHCIDNNCWFVTNDDQVYGLGGNKSGILGLGDNNRVSEPKPIQELCGKGVVKFVTGFDYGLCLTGGDQQVYSWGYNWFFQLGRDTSPDYSWFTPDVIPVLSDKRIADIACGYHHSLALSTDGTVYGWGYNRMGQCGSGQVWFWIECPTRVLFPPNTCIKSIYCYNFCSFAITGGNGGDGLVYSWGQNLFEQLGHQKYQHIIQPLLVPHIDDIKTISHLISSDLLELTYVLTNSKQLYLLNTITRNNSVINNNVQQLCGPYIQLSDNYYYYSILDMTNPLDYTNSMDLFANEHQLTKETLNMHLYKIDNFQIYPNKHNDKFSIITTLGSGAYGTVNKVVDKVSERLFAIKIIEGNNIYELQEEVKQLLKLRSQFVVNYYDAWFESNITDISRTPNNYKLYIQMEFCMKNLKEFIKSKYEIFDRKSDEPMDPIEYYISSHLMLELCECVEYLHTRQPPVIHRDLKPANILVMDKPINNRYLKLCDFGLATEHNHQSQLHTSRTGTQHYMAPEVNIEEIGDDRPVVSYNQKSDVYSLGVILRELFDIIDINYDRNTHIDYKIINTLGSGVFGTVNKVMDKTSEKLFAIKIIDGEFQYELQREVKQLFKLQSKFVVRCYDAWFDQSYRLNIQMEIMSQSLRDVIEIKSKTFQRQSTEPMDPIEYYISSHLMLELCECVEYLHTRHPPVIHRDLKPANILINDKPINNRFLKLCDFGLATDHNRLGSKSQSHTNRAGTTHYMAPEVDIESDVNIQYNEKSDVYSMGVIIKELFDIIHLE